MERTTKWASRLIATQASLIEKPACVWAFWLIALVPLDDKRLSTVLKR